MFEFKWTSGRLKKLRRSLKRCDDIRRHLEKELLQVLDANAGLKKKLEKNNAALEKHQSLLIEVGLKETFGGTIDLDYDKLVGRLGHKQSIELAEVISEKFGNVEPLDKAG